MRFGLMFLFLVLLAQWCLAERAPLETAISNNDIQAITAILHANPELVNTHFPGGNEPPIVRAVRLDKLDALRELLKYHPNLEDRDGAMHYTALDHAVGYGHLEVVQLLIQADTRDISPAEKAKQYPTGLAATPECLKLLLDAGARVDIHEGYTPLHRAAQEGRVSVVAAMLNAGADIEAFDRQFGTPLCVAIKAKQNAVVDLLLAHGASVDMREKMSTSPLHLLCSTGTRSQLEVALLRKPDLNQPNTFGATPLHNAAEAGQAEFIPLLLAAGANPHNAGGRFMQGKTPLFLAANAATVKALVAGGAQVNFKAPLGVTPLHAAAERNSVEVVAALLEAGADINAQESRGQGANTPLINAIVKRNIPLVDLLLTRGADVTLPADGSGGALSRMAYFGMLEQSKVALEKGADPRVPRVLANAVSQDHLDLVKLLVEHGAQPGGVPLNDQDAPQVGSYSTIPICMATSVPMAEYLLAHGATLKVADIKGITPLHVAARSAEPALITFYLEKGADANAVDTGGQTPLIWAARAPWDTKTGRSRPTVIKCLLEHRAKLDATDNDGATALHHALQWGQVDAITLLVDAGLDPNVRDNQGRTPIFWTIGTSQGGKEAIKQLIVKGGLLDARNNKGQTPLGEAIARKAKEHEKIFRELGGNE